jgi:hypothetical protein
MIVSMAGCGIWAVDEQSLIGGYERVLPDGGIEAIELKTGGACVQKIILVGGEMYSASGTWEYTRSRKAVVIKGVYMSINSDGLISRDIGKIINTVKILSVWRRVLGGIVIGASEGVTYEKR